MGRHDRVNRPADVPPASVESGNLSLWPGHHSPGTASARVTVIYMSTDPSDAESYRVLVPLSDNERSARAQARFVGALPDAPGSVKATLTHVLHGEELQSSRTLRQTKRVATVSHARTYLNDRSISVEIVDAGDPYPPTESIVELADEIDADLIVLGGGMHGFLEDLLTGNVTRAVGQRTDRPITVVPEAFADPANRDS